VVGGANSALAVGKRKGVLVLGDKKGVLATAGSAEPMPLAEAAAEEAAPND
jgi:hypothetical protein